MDKDQGFTKMDKGQGLCSRRFGYRAVRSETQPCLKRVLREPFDLLQACGQISFRCQSPFSLHSFTTSSVAGFVSGFFAEMFRGRTPQGYTTQKTPPHKRLRKRRRAGIPRTHKHTHTHARTHAHTPRETGHCFDQRSQEHTHTHTRTHTHTHANTHTYTSRD